MQRLLSYIRQNQGFTLLELSIVILILSIMLGGVLSVIAQNERLANQAELEMKIAAIEDGIIAFTKRSDTAALPCPAPPDLAPTSSGFGVASASGCTALAYDDGSSAAGAVPVRNIGLPDHYAFDPWGNQFTYVVSMSAATTNAFTSNDIDDDSLGVITINNLNGTAITTNAVMALISHGPNGFGAFTAAGVRKSGYSTNSFEQDNCNCTSSAADDTYDSVFYMGINTQSSADSENNFDDITMYRTRSFFKLSGDLDYE